MPFLSYHNRIMANELSELNELNELNYFCFVLRVCLLYWLTQWVVLMPHYSRDFDSGPGAQVTVCVVFHTGSFTCHIGLLVVLWFPYTCQ